VKKENRRPVTTTRFAIVILFASVFVILLVARFFQVMILEPESPDTQASSHASKVERGPILDRSGKILAIQTRLYSVTAWLPNVENISKTAEILASLIDTDAQSLLERMRGESGFLYIRRKVSPSTSEKIRERIEAGDLPGITLEPEYGRNYPQKDLASHVLGFVGTDNIGLDGIELTYEQTLSPEQGDTKHGGTESGKEGNPEYGNQLFLTLDLNIQYMAEGIAEKALKEHDANSVTVLVMDAETGEFLAWSSVPDFDPNRFVNATEEEKQNRPLTYAFEPGSVFKVFSIASLMDLGGITPESTFFCDGAYEREFPDDDTVVINCLGVHGEVNAQKILQYSCNAGAAYASETVGKREFHSKLTEFGFGSPTHLPLPGETAGLLREPRRWSGRTKPTIAIGQEISASSVQIVTAATALTNDGMLLQPHIVKKTVSSDGNPIERNTREPLKRVVSPEVARGVLLMMESATERSGTAWRAKIPNVRTSAKTGTAEKIDPESGKYSEDAFIASCLGIFPTNDPRIITYVAIDHPRGEEFYGGRIAAPLVSELGEKLVTYLGIPTSEETVVRHSGVIQLPKIPDVEIEGTLPDLRGLPKRRLLPLLSREDLEVHFEGEGWVVEQSPPPGTDVEEGMEIHLKFE
jgi:cell division protein FtsI (penicillin-binding protein 3)